MTTDLPKLTEICFRILLCLFAVLGNLSLFFLTVPLNRKIKPYKILLINLALSDLLTNCMVDIPGILVDIYGTWFLGDMYCKIFWFTASVTITNSIFTALAMSVFWFQKLVGSRPVNSHPLRSAELRHLGIVVSLSWLISTAFGVPVLFFCGVFTMKNKGEEQSVFGCQDSFPSRSQKHVYEILYLALANALPVLGMFIINMRIVVFLIRNRKRVSALRCLKAKIVRSSEAGGGEPGITQCRPSEGQIVSCISSISNEFVSDQTTWGTSKDLAKDNEGNFIKEGETMCSDEHKQPPSMIYNPCSAQTTDLCDLNTTNFVLAQDPRVTCKPDNVYSISSTYCKEQWIQGNIKDKLPDLLKSLDSKESIAKIQTRYPSTTTQIRAAISIMSVVGVFLVFWVTYLTLRVKEDVNNSQQVIDTASLIAASYTTIIPYVFIYSMKKCPCGSYNSQ
ncbi:D(2)-like dopamine receptor [Dendropsophus ebraccatus]|uniref:D(2)-like dopamine receptor n=1 Tax=Dendropsophus ebraccatus TaxID=150705 RepID=UPI00383211A4